LERRGKLDRAVEFLPDDEGLRKRLADNQLLTRPELAVLLAYAKLDLAAEINASTLPDEPFFATELESYFPPQLVQRFRHEMEHHRLRREIITDVLTNHIVNLAGPVFIHRLKEISGAPAARCAHAFALADGAFGLSSLKSRIDALDYKVAADIQIATICDITELLRRLGLWFVMNVPESADLGQSVQRYRDGVKALTGTFETLVSDFEAAATEQRIGDLEAAGVPHALAEDIAVLPLLSAAPEIIHLAHARDLSIDLVAGAYFATGEIIGLDRLRSLAGRINASEHWDRLAIRRIVDDLYVGQRALTAKVLEDKERQEGDRAAGAAAAQAWADRHADALNRTRSFLAELERTGDLSIAKLTLANSQLHSLAG
ncbi:MAG: NAD-glutamate dehydrogenase, partial [Alphaproteobacteria bacterium]|nr:NAD-glutamate dehydrogenase [Alphaproteobacteria bacterium]